MLAVKIVPVYFIVQYMHKIIYIFASLSCNRKLCNSWKLKIAWHAQMTRMRMYMFLYIVFFCALYYVYILVWCLPTFIYDILYTILFHCKTKIHWGQFTERGLFRLVYLTCTVRVECPKTPEKCPFSEHLSDIVQVNWEAFS